MDASLDWESDSLWNAEAFFLSTISDSHCGMRSFTRDAYQRMHLRTTGMEFASEIVVNALRENFKIQEVPITDYPREGRRSCAA